MTNVNICLQMIYFKTIGLEMYRAIQASEYIKALHLLRLLEK